MEEAKQNGLTDTTQKLKGNKDTAMNNGKHNNNTSPENQPSPSDTFDLSAFRVNQDFTEQVSVKRHLVTVPVRKPPKQNFIFVREGNEWNYSVQLLLLKEENEHYLVSPGIAALYPSLCSPFTLYTYYIRGGNVALWPVRLPGEDGRDNDWWRCAREIATQHTNKWIRVQANMTLGAYEMFQARGDLEQPKWPEETLEDLVRIAFKGKIIDSDEHDVLRKLRGEM